MFQARYSPGNAHSTLNPYLHPSHTLCINYRAMQTFEVEATSSNHKIYDIVKQ